MQRHLVAKIAISVTLAISGCSREHEPSPEEMSLGVAEHSLWKFLDSMPIATAYQTVWTDSTRFIQPHALISATGDSRVESSWRMKGRFSNVDASGLGDLGFTSGPWDIVQLGDSTGAIMSGCRVLIWSRGPDSTWSVEVDLTIELPEPFENLFADSLRYSIYSTVWPQYRGRVGKPSVEVEALLAAESEFDKAIVERGLLSAYRANVCQDVELFFLGIWLSRWSPWERITERYLSHLEVSLEIVTEHAKVASSGDLGYTTGHGWYSCSANPKRALNFLRIWRRSNSGRWLLALEYLVPVDGLTPDMIDDSNPCLVGEVWES
jgi:ketosteroid isomerase-like protein